MNKYFAVVALLPVIALPAYANSDMPGTASVIIETVPVVTEPAVTPTTEAPIETTTTTNKIFDIVQSTVDVGGQTVAVEVTADADGGSTVAAPNVDVADVPAEVQFNLDPGGNVAGSTIQTQIDAGGAPAAVNLTVDAGGNVGGTVISSQPIAAVGGSEVKITVSVGADGQVVATAVEVNIEAPAVNVPPALAGLGPVAAAGLGTLSKSLKSLSIEGGVLSPEQYAAALNAFDAVRVMLVDVQIKLDNAIVLNSPPAEIQQLRVFQTETVNKVNQAQVQLTQLAQNAAQVAAQAAQTQQGIIGKLPDVVGGAKKTVKKLAEEVNNDPKIIANTTFALLNKTQEKLQALNSQLSLPGFERVVTANQLLARQLKAFFVDKGQAHQPAYNPTVQAVTQATNALRPVADQLRQSAAPKPVRLSAAKSLVAVARSIGKVEKLLADFRQKAYARR